MGDARVCRFLVIVSVLLVVRCLSKGGSIELMDLVSAPLTKVGSRTTEDEPPCTTVYEVERRYVDGTYFTPLSGQVQSFARKLRLRSGFIVKCIMVSAYNVTVLVIDIAS